MKQDQTIDTVQIAFQILRVILLKMYVDQHTKSQVHKMHVFKIYITAVCLIFLIKTKPARGKGAGEGGRGGLDPCLGIGCRRELEILTLFRTKIL